MIISSPFALPATLVAGASLVPNAIILSSTVIGRCDEIKLDGTLSTGSGGRDFESSSFTVISVTDSASGDPILVSDDERRVVNDRLQEATGLSMTIPNNLLSPGREYQFSLAVTNFFGNSASSAVEVMKLDFDVPHVLIRGPRTISTLAQNFLFFTADADFPESCTEAEETPSSSSLNFFWEVRGKGETDSNVIGGISSGTTTLAIPPGVLKPGTSYDVEISATMTSSEYISTDLVVLDVGYADIMAIIMGGNRTTSVYNSISFDASPSFDPDNPTAALSFVWKQVDKTEIVKTSTLNFEVRRS